MVEDIDRVRTGVPGLDDILNGGYPKGLVILISGGAGTGKSIYGIQFLYTGITKYEENGILVAVEERPRDIRRYMLGFGWDLKKLEDQNKLAIIDASAARLGIPSGEKYVEMRPFELDSLITTINKIVEKMNAKRLVIDSIPSLFLQFEHELAIRREILRLGSLVAETGCTTILTTEVEAGESRLSKFGVEEFICQGLIQLFMRERGNEMKRSLVVRKMRGTKHSTRRYPFDITPSGIAVFPGEEVY
ncbi:MAG: ATPase [Euryarchaeota archaeon]|nr:ATPase [Euryarchaeota archaeon]